MNKLEALEALRGKGKKITHKNFITGEFVSLEGGLLKFEDGVKVSLEKFLQSEHTSLWETDYAIHYSEELTESEREARVSFKYRL